MNISDFLVASLCFLKTTDDLSGRQLFFVIADSCLNEIDFEIKRCHWTEICKEKPVNRRAI